MHYLPPFDKQIELNRFRGCNTQEITSFRRISLPSIKRGFLRHSDDVSFYHDSELRTPFMGKFIAAEKRKPHYCSQEDSLPRCCWLKHQQFLLLNYDDGFLLAGFIFIAYVRDIRNLPLLIVTSTNQRTKLRLTHHKWRRYWVEKNRELKRHFLCKEPRKWRHGVLSVV